MGSEMCIRDRYRGYSDLTLEKFFSTDPNVLQYRQAIVEDLVEHPMLYDAFCQSVAAIQNVTDLRKVLSSDFSVDSALSAVRYLEMYEELVDLFSDVFTTVSYTHLTLPTKRIV